MNPKNALLTHRLLLRAAFAFGNLFAWIFFFQYEYLVTDDLGLALSRTALLYALSYIVTCLLTPYAAARLRNGMRAGMRFGVLCAALAFLLLGGALDAHFSNAYVFLAVCFALFLGAFRALYWVPYSVEAQEYSSHQRRLSISAFSIALMPVIAGTVLETTMSAPSWLLYVAAALSLFALLPLLRLPDVHEGFPWSYRETFSHFTTRVNRPLFWTSLLQGFEGAALLLLWPIAVFIIVASSYAVLGFVISLTLLLALLLRDSVATLLQRFGIHNSSAVRASVAASAWIGRLLVISPTSVIFVDSYSHLGAPGRNDISNGHLEASADASLYVDEYTALKEMGLSCGRVMMCIVAAFFAAAFSISFAFATCFVLAACAAAAGIYLTTRQQKRI